MVRSVCETNDVQALDSRIKVRHPPEVTNDLGAAFSRRQGGCWGLSFEAKKEATVPESITSKLSAILNIAVESGESCAVAHSEPISSCLIDKVPNQTCAPGVDPSSACLFRRSPFTTTAIQI